MLQRGEKLRKDAVEVVAHDAAAGALAYGQADSLLALAEETAPEWFEPIVMRGNIAYRRSRLAHSATDRRAWVDAAVDHADRALAVVSNDAAALEVRGTARYFCWLRCEIHDHDERDSVFTVAKADLERAVDEDPSLASAYSTLSHLYYQTGDVPSVVLAARSAYEADAYLALANDVLFRLFFGHHDLEQLDLAAQRCDEGAQRFKHDFRFVMCQIQMMTTNVRDPDVDEAWRLLEQLETLTSIPLEPRRSRMLVGGVIARAGLSDSANSVLLSARAGHDIDPQGELLLYEARMRVLLGDNDEAIELPKQYVAANPGHFARGRNLNWWWRELRNDPRFQEIVRLAQ